MSAVTLPMDLPGVQDAAEKLAREWTDIRTAEDLACEAAMGARYFLFDQLDAPTRKQRTEKMARILCDLSRPASMDWWARWLAERVGLTVGATAPGWERVHAPNEFAGWRLRGVGSKRRELVSGRTWAADILVPGISALTNPAEALRAACLAIAGAP